jgi:hypothetical protein
MISGWKKQPDFGNKISPTLKEQALHLSADSLLLSITSLSLKPSLIYSNLIQILVGKRSRKLVKENSLPLILKFMTIN